MTSVGDDRWPTAGDVAERPGAPPQETDELFPASPLPLSPA